ncbi:MAG TPA: long-chain fatty acid--CoA ligase [Acidimicrobiia bacterium]|nr:long-chain fatty acid--CoA ligase [Acidimicrobiia bacterium]
MLTTIATSYPERVAWIWDGGSRTYGETNRRADALAHALVAFGLERGDRVALYLHNCPEVMESFFGVLKAGGAVVPLNPRFTAEEVEYHVGDSRARFLIVDDAGCPLVAARRPRLKTVDQVIQLGGELHEGHLDFESLVETAAGRPFVSVDVDDDELAWLAYTSGTTGRSKGAMLTHGVLVFESLCALADVMRLEVEDVGMHASPLTHGAGHNALAFTMKGCTQVILSKSGFDVDKFLDWVPRYKVNALFMVPTMIKMVIDHPRAAGADLSSLKWVVYGGAPMYAEDLKKALDVIGPVFVQIFGQTESPMTGTMLRAEEHMVDGPLAHLLTSCGRARSGVQIRILDENDEPLPPGGIGEICIRGASVMPGYWERPEANADTLRNGWLHTGDIGKMDEQGYVYILDRTRDMVISGGLNVYPREVEEVMISHPAISEVCVFGIPDPKWGEALKAHVVLHDGQSVTEAELLAFVGRHLAGYKKPKTVDFVAELPKTTYGKLDKKAVRAPYWAGQDRMVG